MDVAHHSSGEVYSLGLCDIPSFDGTNIIDVGQTADVEQLGKNPLVNHCQRGVKVPSDCTNLSCPAPDTISITASTPTVFTAAVLTESTHSGENVTLGDTKSVVQVS